jgi:uncharacterized phage-associated protein
MPSALEVAKYLTASLQMDNLKLQKLLYYSQAVHLVLHDRNPLFMEDIEAWDYGPVVPQVYHNYKKYGLDTIQSKVKHPTLSQEELRPVNYVIETFGKMSGRALINQTHSEWPWRNAYSPVRPSKIIPIDSMYEYFKDNLDLSNSGLIVKNDFNVKTSIFKEIKECVDFLTPDDEDVCLSDNPYIDIEAIASNRGINIHRVPPDEVLYKHAILIGKDIFLNNNDNNEKQRFSIAHEIYHFLTRRNNEEALAVARQGETWKKKNAGSDIAIEEEIADYFAANLLIPTERFILWEDKTDEEIAKAFGVEPKCINKRKEEIEYELKMMVPQSLPSDIDIEYNHSN